MSDEDDIEALTNAVETKADPTAAAIALGHQGQSLDPHAAAVYLRKQSHLLDLQIENLRKQDRYELSHLRWRTFNDRMRGALQIVAFLVAVAIASGLGALVWQAYEAYGLVAEPLKTPPDFAQKGLDGTVLSQQLLDKLNRLSDEAALYDLRKPSSIAGSWRDQSNVVIPSTGISLDQLSRLLRNWLGHETRISGEVYRTSGGIAVTVRAGANPGTTFFGREADLDTLLEKSASALFKQVQIYSYVNAFGLLHKEDSDTIALAQHLAEQGPPEERAYALLAYGSLLMYRGDFRGAVPPTDEAVRIEPDGAYPYWQRIDVDDALEHEETSCLDTDAEIRLLHAPSASQTLRADALVEALPQMQALADECRGAFLEASTLQAKAGQSSFDTYDQVAPLAVARDLVLAHDPGAARAILAPKYSDTFALEQFVVLGIDAQPNFEVLAAEGDWKEAADDMEQADRVTRALPDIASLRHTMVWPRLAYAWAHLGDVKHAEALIALTPSDCALCLDMRGRIAEIARDFGTAERWYRRALQDAPDLPFVASDWGAMLLHRGDYDGAIARFEQAHEKGPHFADPLELWGEALMLKNRSDLALEKFEEANRYAPHWGRLHLKWGEALSYVDRKDEARTQFHAASAMDLSVSDSAELARVEASHG